MRKGGRRKGEGGGRREIIEQFQPARAEYSSPPSAEPAQALDLGGRLGKMDEGVSLDWVRARCTGQRSAGVCQSTGGHVAGSNKKGVV